MKNIILMRLKFILPLNWNIKPPLCDPQNVVQRDHISLVTRLWFNFNFYQPKLTTTPPRIKYAFVRDFTMFFLFRETGRLYGIHITSTDRLKPCIDKIQDSDFDRQTPLFSFMSLRDNTYINMYFIQFPR